MKLPTFVVLAASLLLASACSTSHEGQHVPFKTIASGTSSIYTDSMGMEIGDKERLLAVWKGIKRDEKDLPDIDFKKHSVLAIFLGQQATGGYRIKVDRIVDAITEWQVYVKIKKPAEDSTVTQAQTQPYTLISVPYDWKIINYYYSIQP